MIMHLDHLTVRLCRNIPCAFYCRSLIVSVKMRHMAGGPWQSSTRALWWEQAEDMRMGHGWVTLLFMALEHYVIYNLAGTEKVYFRQKTLSLHFESLLQNKTGKYTFQLEMWIILISDIASVNLAFKSPIFLLHGYIRHDMLIMSVEQECKTTCKPWAVLPKKNPWQQIVLPELGQVVCVFTSLIKYTAHLLCSTPLPHSSALTSGSVCVRLCVRGSGVGV